MCHFCMFTDSLTPLPLYSAVECPCIFPRQRKALRATAHTKYIMSARIARLVRRRRNKRDDREKERIRRKNASFPEYSLCRMRAVGLAAIADERPVYPRGRCTSIIIIISVFRYRDYRDYHTETLNSLVTDSTLRRVLRIQ